MRRGVANNQATLIVLNCTSQNLAGTGTELTCENDERPIPGHSTFQVVICLNPPTGVFDLDDRPFVDKQARQVDCLGQAASTVAAQVSGNDTSFLKSLINVALSILSSRFASAIVYGPHPSRSATHRLLEHGTPRR